MKSFRIQPEIDKTPYNIYIFNFVCVFGSRPMLILLVVEQNRFYFKYTKTCSLRECMSGLGTQEFSLSHTLPVK